MPKNIFIACILSILLSSLSACSSTGLLLANSLARMGDYQVIDDIQYGPEATNGLTIFSPEAINSSRPTIIFFYGGCWGACLTLKREHYVFVAEALTTHGFNVVIPDYRLYPKVGITEIMNDAQSAVEWVSSNIQNYQGDPNQILLMGHSAGAHIAALLTLDERYLSNSTYQKIKGMIGMAGPYDFLPFDEDYQRKVFAPESDYANTQPINFVDGSEPPMLLLYGHDDTTVKPRNIKSLTAKTNLAGGQVIARYYQGLDHIDLISALSIPLRNSQPVLTDIIHFVENVSNSKAIASTPKRTH